MNRNKAITIIVIAVAVVLVALAVFYFFFRKSGEVYVPKTNPDVSGTGLPVGTDVFRGIASSSATGAGGISGASGSYENKPQTFERLHLISSLPVAGATLFQRNAETFIHYVERATGHIYETSTARVAPSRISNTTIPKIYEARWVKNGQGVIVRYLKEGTDEVQTFYAALKSSASSTLSLESELQDGTFLPTGIMALTVSPGEEKIFYLQKSGGEVFGTRANPNGTSKSQLFSSQATEWLASWNQPGTITLVTKASSDASGYLYLLDANTGASRRVLGDIRGLTALVNSDSSLLLYSETTATGFALKLLEVKTQKVSSVGVTTLPEKCVWSNTDKTLLYCAVSDSLLTGRYPDVWYQGLASLTDNLWKINTKTGETTMILSPAEVAHRTMDITNLSLSEKENYLLFTNKKDLSLWLLDLNM